MQLSTSCLLISLLCLVLSSPRHPLAAAAAAPDNASSRERVMPLRQEPDVLFWHFWQRNLTSNASLPDDLSGTYRGNWQQVTYQKELDAAPLPHRPAGLLQFSLHLQPATAAGVFEVTGEVTLHDGLDILGLDWRMQLEGRYVNASRRLHAVATPMRLTHLVPRPDPPPPPYDTYATVREPGFDAAAQPPADLRASYLHILRRAAQQYSRRGAVQWYLRRTMQHSLVPCEFRLELEALPPSLDPAAAQKPFTIPEGVRMVGALFSENCNVSWSLDAAAAEQDVLHRRANRYSWLAGSVAALQVVLLVRQMEAATSSRAAAARISMLAVAGQALIDAYLCLLHLTFALVADALFSEFAVVAFLEFVLFALLEMRLIVVAWRAQRGAADLDIFTAHQELSTLYTRFYGALLLGIFLAYKLDRHAPLLLLALHSFWVPQILHSARTGSRPPLRPPYVLGTSLSRLALPLYFLGCPRNLLSLPASPAFCLLLVAWVAAQLALLALQQKYGPRSVVPKFLLPPHYDYHRAATPRELGLGANPEASSAGGGDIETGHGGRECVICMTPVEVAREQARMLTPCGHFFHAHCLQRWMDVKMECPTCRTALPPP